MLEHRRSKPALDLKVSENVIGLRGGRIYQRSRCRDPFQSIASKESFLRANVGAEKGILVCYRRTELKEVG